MQWYQYHITRRRISEHLFITAYIPRYNRESLADTTVQSRSQEVRDNDTCVTLKHKTVLEDFHAILLIFIFMSFSSPSYIVIALVYPNLFSNNRWINYYYHLFEDVCTSYLQTYIYYHTYSNSTYLVQDSFLFHLHFALSN